MKELFKCLSKTDSKFLLNFEQRPKSACSLVLGPGRGDKSIPMQWQSPGATGLSTQCTELLRGGHVPVCPPNPHQTLCSEVPGEDTQSLVPLHTDAGAPSL